ncbi:MAG: hypothetical protein Q4C70_03005 [Planctomycetia bacterium]|nr:hypothetical protein [Planctomycetia bacterium]
MDSAHYYREWLQLEVAEGETLNYYEVLGLENGEPNLQVIRAAVNEKLDLLYHVNREEAIEAYTNISGQILEARYTLLDVQRKHAYDVDLLTGQGGRAWKSYHRPGLLERSKQFGLILTGLALGCCVMFMMAAMVERNPDGSIVYRAEVKVAKPDPFTTPMEMVVYRPEKANDFLEGGYVVALRGMNALNVQNTANVANTDNTLNVVNAKNTTNSNAGTQTSADDGEFFDFRPTGELIGETAPTQVTEKTAPIAEEDGQSEIESLFPADMLANAGNADNVNTDNVAEVETVENTSASKKGRVRNPLYDRVRRSETDKVAKVEKTEKADSETHAEDAEEADGVKESVKKSVKVVRKSADAEDMESMDDADVLGTELPLESPEIAAEIDVKDVGEAEDVEDVEENSVKVAESETSAQTGMIDMPPVVENTQVGFSPLQMLEMMKEVTQNVTETDSQAQESLCLVQYQMCLQLAQKCEDEAVALEPAFVTDFVEYSLEITRNLGNFKHFEKASQLVASLETLGEKRSFAPAVLEEVSTWKEELGRQKDSYERGQKVLAELKENPDDPALNTRYAMMLWNENQDFEESLPYLVKSQYQSIRDVAQLELTIQNEKYAGEPKVVLQVGDLWWNVAEQINNPKQKQVVKNHARELYRKVDQSLLSDQQQLRVSSLEGPQVK